MIQWGARSDSSRKGYAAQFKKVFGTPLDKEWTRWIRFEQDWQVENLKQVRSSPITPFRNVRDRGLGSVSRPYYDARDGVIYLGVRYPGTLGHIAALNPTTGSIRKITEVLGPALFYVTSLAFDDSSRTIFYTTDNNDWRDLVAVDVETGRKRLLIKDLRVGDLVHCPADSAIWGIQAPWGNSFM